VAPPARILTTRQLNRAVLARQMLLERARLPLPTVLEHMGGLQAQYAPSMYIGLWSRVEGFHRDDLTRALERRTVVQGTLMRVTIHLVSARDYWPFVAGIRSSRQAWWLRAQRPRADPNELVEAAARLRDRLANGPVRGSGLGEIVGPSFTSGVGLWVDLVRVPPSGTWERRRADLFGLAENWIPPIEVSTEAGVEHVVRRYLGGFGPAAPKDIATWAGLATSDVAPALARLRLRRFRREDGQDLVDLPGAPLPEADTPAPVRFIPTWDAMLLAHARHKGVIAENHRVRIFDAKYPQSKPTFLVDGTVAGTWRYDGGGVLLDPWVPLSRRTLTELTDEGERLAALHA
jgi:hypothetical protein